MANFLYVDNSNLWIEGMHVAAVEGGLTRDIEAAHQEKICDYGWKLDFAKLYAFAGGANVARAVLFGSCTTQNDSLWDAARRSGFEVVVHPRNSRNKEKKVDAEIITNMLKDSYEQFRKGDEITLVAGDKDYVPALENLVVRGIPVHLVFWSHAAEELKNLCTKFVCLNPYLNLLSRQMVSNVIAARYQYRRVSTFGTHR